MAPAGRPRRSLAARRRSKVLSHLLEAAVFFAFVGLLKPFDTDRASAIGGRLGRWLAPLGRRQKTLEQIEQAMPELGRAGATRVSDAMFENFGRMLAEMGRLESFSDPAQRHRFDFEGLEHIAAAQASGRPIIFVSGHFANWELGVPALKHLGIDFADVTQPLDNPYIDRFLNRRRKLAGFENPLERGADASRELFSRVKQSKPVVLMVDLRIKEGVPVPLFGMPALTTVTPATLALDFDGIILAGAPRRSGNGARFSYVIRPPITVPPSGNRARDVLALTAAINQFVESEIRNAPGHWFWNNQRWRPVTELSRRATRLLAQAGQGTAGD